MRFLFVEPFYGGSHRDFADGWIAHSRYEIHLLSLPARFWKWRMRGAALHFFRKIDGLSAYDGLIVSDLMSLSDFTSLFRGRRPPTLIYFHENQLTYPLAPGERMDLQFGFTDITSALSADRILFNSRYHYNCFFSNLPRFIGRMPEFRPLWVIEEIRKKAGVLYPGCHFDPKERRPSPLPAGPPLIVWNHRWEFDKNPDLFFRVLDRVDRMGIPFRLALLGENYQVRPKAFVRAKKRFKDQIVQFGYLESKKDYQRWLAKGTVVVSTADQENFGISVTEAMHHGCLPLLPDKLSYPEILPREFHREFLYKNEDDLVCKLAALLKEPGRYAQNRNVLSEMVARYAWTSVISDYDRELSVLAERD